MHPEQPENQIAEHQPAEHQVAEIANLKALQAALQLASDAEKKLEIAIHFMEHALSQTGSPHFKDFWEAKKICMELFKEQIHPSVRMQLWAKYSEISREARRLKEIFDEQSAFACEQIEMAIVAIEQELAQFIVSLNNASTFALQVHPRSLEANYAQYQMLQYELNGLNVYSTKVNVLRKELIKTEMRIRDKNRFFQRLSQLGDTVFPRRKERIQEISQLFLQDVETFIADTFDHEMKTRELFVVRDEIKALQSVAKELTLNTEAFSQTRKRLSECWDSIKHLVDERKKEEVEQRVGFRQHRDEFHHQLQQLKKQYEEKAIGVKEAEQQLETIIDAMRHASLGTQEIRFLRENVTGLRDLFSSELDSEAREAKERIRKKEEERNKEQVELAHAIKALGAMFDELIAEAEQMEPQPFTDKYEEAVQKLSTLRLERAEKAVFDRKLYSLRECYEEKKEKKLLLLSQDDREKLQQLKMILKERKERRQIMKNELEKHRRAKGGSGLDFEQALEANQLLELDKERLQKLEAAIAEIEEQIAELRRK